jgi:beta-lactamase superfamily II metal-dependent hydrolase
MAIELDFFPVGSGNSSGDAIVVRHGEGQNAQIVVIDGGYEETGQSVCAHIRYFYGVNVIDDLISTHPDNDHMSGLRTIMETMSVRRLWMHAPFMHAEAILPLFRSRRWAADNLRTALRRAYPYVEELLQLAGKQGTLVYEPFEGKAIGPFAVLSPSPEMYRGLLPQFRDTPAPDVDALQTLGHWVTGIGRRTAQITLKHVREDWYTETLREGGTTAAENESSVILYGQGRFGGILLTADAGLNALRSAYNYAIPRGVSFQSGLWIFQVPHHGSRNNIAPSYLNAFLGPILLRGEQSSVQCVISAGAEDEDHPRDVVVNALIRRGGKVSVTRGTTANFTDGMRRPSWNNPLPSETLRPVVEEYD